MTELSAEPETVLSLGDLIQSRREELADAWERHLAAIAGTVGIGAGGLAGRAAHDLLFSILAEASGDSIEFTESQAEALVSQLEKANIGLADLYAQIEALKNAFQTVFGETEERNIAATARIALDRTTYQLIRRKAARHEQAMELGPIGIAELDASGDILYANAAMSRLVGSASGHLASLFQESDRAHVDRSLNSRGKPVGPLEVIGKGADGVSKRIFLDVRPLADSQTDVKAYATAIDIASIVAREEKFLDRLGLAAIKFNSDLVVTYANQASRDLLGSEIDIRGRSVYDVLPNTRNQSEQFQRRREGAADIYETEIVRPYDGRKIPVSVAGTPILDDDGGFLGSLGLIRSLETERAAAAIHAAIDSEHDEKRMFSALTEIIHPLIPFDYCGITRFSDESDHAALWFGQADGQLDHLSRRWWPIKAAQKREHQQKMVIPSFSEYIRTSYAELAEDSDVVKFEKKGYRSMLRFPIEQENRPVASIFLLTRGDRQYTEGDCKLLSDLPMEQAIRMALYYRSRRKYMFRHELLTAMASCTTATGLAETLASRLADHYHWPHIAIARVCKTEGVFRLLAEAPVTAEKALSRSEFRLALTAGVTGHVYQTRASINIADVHAHDLPVEFVPVWPGTLSELCLPVVWDGEVQWVLNVEDEMRDAFSKDDEREVSSILTEVQDTLARITRQYLLESAIESTSDAVLITDLHANVTWVNPATLKMVGVGAAQDALGPFQRFFSDSRTATRMFESAGAAAREVDLAKRDGGVIPVLLSGTELPEDLSSKVFVARDLTGAKRLQKLEELRKLFQEVALQTHAPLAFIDTWVRHAASHGPETDLYPKILTQLKKLEITYDRLALSLDCKAILDATRIQKVDVGVEIKRVLYDLPKEERDLIDICGITELPYISADPLQISFMFSSILSYLSRLCGGRHNCVRISLQSGPAIQVVFHAAVTSSPSGSDADPQLERARFELALGEPTIREFAEKNAATYERKVNDDSVEIGLTFRT
jgi:PAS domain S-box-containing protein